MNMDKLWYLKKCDIFQGFQKEAMDRVQAISTEKTIPRKQIIYAADDKNEVMFILKKGRVRIFKLSADGKMMTLAILKGGDIFGAMYMISGGTTGAYAETLEDSYICSIKQEDFHNVIKEMPELAFRMIEKINKQLKEAEDRIEDLVFRDVPGRIASILFKLAEQFGKSQGKATEIDLKITHQELADMVGATRETVSVILSDFRKDGMISISNKQITILKEKDLKEWAGKE